MAEGKPEAIIDRRRSINISCKNSIDFDNNVKNLLAHHLWVHKQGDA